MARATKTNRRKQPFSVSKPVLLAAAATALLVGAVLMWQAAHPAAVVNGPTPTPLKGNTTHDEPTPTPTQTATPGGTPLPSPTPNGPATVSKPVLQKSSGNAPGSSVPAGAAVEFTCYGTANAKCEIILTDRTNASNQINLGAKTITSNNRGEYFAIWDWTAVKGSWNVVARSSGSNGVGVASDSQVLEVK